MTIVKDDLKKNLQEYLGKKLQNEIQDTLLNRITFLETELSKLMKNSATAPL